MFKHTILLAAVAGLVFAQTPAAQAGTILVSDSLNPGLVVGDTFHLVFVTSTSVTATSSAISFYNTKVNEAAELTGSLVKDKGWTWSAIGSTDSISASANTGTSGGGGYPIYLLNNTKIADDYADLWDGSIAAFLNIDEAGTSLPETKVWTGTQTDGEAFSFANGETDDHALGTTTVDAGSGVVESRHGLTDEVGARWVSRRGKPQVDSYRLYAFSEPLEIITPEPATMALLGLGGLGMWLGRRRDRG